MKSGFYFPLGWLPAGLLLASVLASPALAQSPVTFTYRGVSETYKVPAGVTSIQVVARGASGGFSQSAATPVQRPNLGATVQATLLVTPGEELTVMVGGSGAFGTNGFLGGGFNGGGNGYGGGGGGGATDLRRAYTSATSTGDYLTSRNALVVAGGAGGSYGANSLGGNGGAPAGGSGTGGSAPGLGATQAGPGGGGTSGSGPNGGSAATSSGSNDGGGGGGYYGGGAAKSFGTGSGGGGGSSFVTAVGSSSISYSTPAGVSGSGELTITPVVPADLTVSTTTSIPAGTYNTITVTGTGNGILAGDVTVIGGVTVQSGGTLSDGCATISGAGSFTLAAGGTLGICNAAGISSSGATGAVQVTGTRSFDTDASYVYNGTAAQSTGSGLPGQVRNLTTTNANAVTLAAPTSVAQVVTVGAAGNLVLNGQALTLLSTSTGTALVVNAGAGLVSGNTAVVQRYIDGSLNSGPGYRHFSVPLTGTTLADFATSSYTPVVNSAYNSSPTPGAVTPFPTLYTYNQSALASRTNNLSAFDKGWLSPSDLTNNAIPGIGYCVNISAGQVVDFVGTLYNTNLTVGMSRTTGATAADGGWQLIGNPYPAPLDLSLVQPADRLNLDAAAYVVQSTGKYAGGYRAYVNGVSTSATNSPLLPLGQGFFVRVSAGQTSGSFTFRRAQRVTSFANQAAFQRTAADPRPAVRLELAGAGLADSWVTYAEAGATPAFDSQLDAGKLPNSTGLNLSSVAGADNLAIDGRPAFTAATVLPLVVGVPAAGTYSLGATNLANLPAGLDAYLRDAQTGQLTKLAAGTAYSFGVTATEAQALVVGRFTLQFSATTPLATAASLAAAAVTVYPNPARESFTVVVPAVAGASQVSAELRNALGQLVRQQRAALPAAGATFSVPTATLAPGVYVLRLQAGSSTSAQRVVIQ